MLSIKWHLHSLGHFIFIVLLGNFSYHHHAVFNTLGTSQNTCGTDTLWFCNHPSYLRCFVSGALHFVIFLATEAHWTGVFREQSTMTSWIPFLEPN